VIIYMARNRLNGKVYIGQTVLSLAERKGDHRRKAFIHGSRSHFHAAIRRYGFEVFEWRVLERVLLREALNPSERAWIKKFHSTNPRRGYNNTHGGDTFEFTEETKRKIGNAGRGRKLKPEQIEAARVRMAGSGNPFYGKRHTEEANAKNRAAHVGKKLKPEHKAKCLKRGEDNGRASVSESTVREIKRMLAEGIRPCDVRELTGASKQTIGQIKLGRSWRHVQI
jgi:group I intron endonuclease